MSHKYTPEQRIEVFWSRVDKSGGTDSCWEWQAYREPFGHGAVNWGGTLIRAHRLAWILTNGAITDGLFVLHKCDNPPCCNPAHLFLGTQADNVHDMDRKGRRKVATGKDSGKYTHPESIQRGDDHWARKHPELVLRGDRNGMHKHPEKALRGEAVGISKLKEYQVRDIRSRYAAGHISQQKLADEYGVHQSVISDIVLGYTWRHVL